MPKDYYQTLGVERTASQDDIKKAFRRLAGKYHPDQATGDKAQAEAKFKEISEAYDTLGDTQKRSAYDQFGSGGNPFSAGGGDHGNPFGGGGFDFNFSQAQGFGDIFETFFGQQQGNGSRRNNSRTRGDDLEAQVRITFEQSMEGATAEFELPRLRMCSHCSGRGAEPGSKTVTCDTCKGTGEIITTQRTIFGTVQQRQACHTCGGEGTMPEHTCTTCHGTGRVRERQKLKVKIPAGIQDGAVIRLTGQGDTGQRGGDAGDLFVRVSVAASKDFERRGNDIYAEAHIHITQAVLGDEISLPTVHGNVKLKIPAGTQSGQVFKLASHGSPIVNRDTRGDHYVTIQIEVPKKLSKKERDLYAELAKEAGVKPADKKGWFGL